MAVIWRKIWRDLAYHKTRTFVVVFSTAVGVFAFGLVFGLSDRMRTRMTADHSASRPAHITFRVSPFGEEIVEAVKQEAGVAEVEAETWTGFQWKYAGDSEWEEGDLIARSSFASQQMNLIGLVDGEWPGRRTLSVERQSAEYFGLNTDLPVLVQSGRHSERSLPLVGIVRVPAVFPPQLGGDATFYATPETVEYLTGLRGYNRLNLRMATFSQEEAEEVSQRVQARLERSQLTVFGYTIADPEVHWLQQTVDTLFLILAILGALSLGISAFLIVNTVNALIAEQVWQIGVMKVLGATAGRVVQVYLVSVLFYGMLALLLSVPLGAIAVHQMANWLLSFINIDEGPFQVTTSVIALQAGVGLAVPLLAALLPVLGGARITPHQAIRKYGLGFGFGMGWFDRLIGKIRYLPRPLALSLRNTFRRKARVTLTLLTLTLSGAVFMTVVSVGYSLSNTLEALINDFGFDVMVGFESPQLTDQLTQMTESVSGIDRVEVWDRQGAALNLADGQDREMFLWGVPPASQMFRARVVSGRALLPGDERAILLNSKIASDEGIRVGDEILLTIGERESSWTVVGLILNVNNNQRDNFVPLVAVTRELGRNNQGSVVMVTSEQAGAGSQQRLARALRQVYAERGMEIDFEDTATALRNRVRRQFEILVLLLLAMTVLMAVVGGLGLMGTMTINLIERGREIGVMRAIGATSFAVAGVFVTEGVMVGIFSWLLAVPLSYPGARLFSDLVGTTLIQAPLEFLYPLEGVGLWLVVVTLLSALASFWPAFRATKISVREALAYE